MEDEKLEKIPIDARLLSDAVIELNISRRSVGLYPREHPITRDSLERAFGFLQKLFELRGSITLGIAKDVLMIDEYVLDKRNPVFKEFAVSLHSKGLAAVTLYSGLVIEELLSFHELIVSKDTPLGQGITELAEKNGLKHIRLTPLDISKFSFAEGRLREDRGDAEIWENYIYGLIEGKLADEDSEGVILNIPPEDIALLINDRMSGDVHGETYDRVITTYLRKKEHSGIRPEVFSRFLSLVNNLSPELKQQFLSRAFSHPSMEAGEVERLLGELKADDIEKFMLVFEEYSSLVPESLRNLLDKFQDTKVKGSFFDMLPGNQAFVHDIEIDESILRLFQDDKFGEFVTKDYQEELKRMLKLHASETVPLMEELETGYGDEEMDRKYSELLLELLDVDFINREEYLNLLTKISGTVNDFLETGRFSEISYIHNTLYSHSLTGKFKEEARSMLEYFFRSQEFIIRLIDVLKLWGRHDREGVIRLANVQKRYLLDPLFDALSGEMDASVRKFLLQVLGSLGSDVTAEAVKRLNDTRWYVVRNMIYLIRESGGAKYVKYIRPFAKDENKKICMEAVKTLLHFKTPDSLSYIKLYLQDSDPELREQAIKLAGLYKCKDAVPYLLTLIEKKDFLGTESYYKVSVVKSLGYIGDPKALNALDRLYRSKTLLYRGSLEELKVEIFRGLENYPYGSTIPLLELGLKSKNEEIRSISERLLVSGGKRDASG